jgi:small-conductance mechanosensitive channel
VALNAVEAIEQRLHPNFRRALLCAVPAIAALSVGSGLGGLHAHEERRRLAAAGLAAAFAILGAISVRSAANEASRVTALRGGAGTATAVRLSVQLVGFLIVLLATLDVLNVPIGRLLVGGAITGVVIGIAAQQSLGNVAAGVVMLIARPFTLGERVKIRSGTLGGTLEGTITSIGLVYTTLETDEGSISLPNTPLLTASVGRVADPATQSIDLPRSVDLNARR